MRNRLVPLLVASALALTACGGGGGSIEKVGSSTETSSDDALAAGDLCASLESSDGPDEVFVAGVPAEYRAAATALADFVGELDSMGDNESGDVDPSRLAEVLTADGLPDDLEAFAQYAEEECGPNDGLDAIRAVGAAATVAGADEVPEYCEALDTRFINGDEGPDTLTDVVDIAPPEHADALEQLATADPEQMTSASADELFGPIFGIGVYAESVCGIEGALSQTLLGMIFMGMDGGTDDGGEGDGTIPGVDPTQFPEVSADAANAALPADSGITFGVVTVDLEDGDGYLASIVAPTDWTYDTFFNVEFTPPEGAGIFTSVEAGAGCDGGCQPTDWEARVRGESGAIANFTANHPAATEAPIAGSEGVVLTDTSDGAQALILRWDDRADKYFSCEIELEDEFAPLLPAFVAACTSSEPGWFPVG